MSLSKLKKAFSILLPGPGEGPADCEKADMGGETAGFDEARGGT